MHTKHKILKVILLWLLKFFIPPLVGAVFLAVMNHISTFDTVLWGYATLFENIRIGVILLTGTIVTFYVYYLLAYLVFFLYLIILEKTTKLNLVIVMVSGFIYGLIPLFFDNNYKSVTNIVICLVIAVSGAICAACYYYLDKKFRPLTVVKS